MNKEIRSIYIIDGKGKPIFIREHHSQGSGSSSADHALLSRFVTALQSFATELGEEDTRIIELGDEKIYTLKDGFTKFFFVLNCEPDSKSKKMFKILNDIKNLFLQKFMGNFTASEEVKKKIMVSFLEDLNHILNPFSKLENFFKP